MNINETTRAYDVAVYLGYLDREATQEERQRYFDLVNIERTKRFERTGHYGDGWGAGIATVNGFIRFNN